jgi:hypothetical protein
MEQYNRYRRRRSTINNQIGLVLPSSAIVEVASSLSLKQRNLLAIGPAFVTPCQSRCSRESIDDIVARQYACLADCFTRGLNTYCMSAKDQCAREFFQSLEQLVRRMYTTPISPRLLARANREHRLVHSIRRYLASSHVILRRTDKSKVFHLGHVDDHRQKACQYMQKTNAYRLLTDEQDPCMDQYDAVLALIHPLLSKRAIDLTIWKRNMRPNANNIKLAHLYFNPKPHKVN